MFFLKQKEAVPGEARSSRMEKGALLISAFFHPLLMPLYSVFRVFTSGCGTFSMPPESRTEILTLVFAGSFLLPLAAILIFRFTGLISSLRMEERRDRHLPHLAAFLSFTALAFVFYFRLPAYPLAWLMMLGTAVSVGLTGIITRFWKISSHMAGTGGFLGFCMMMDLACVAGMQGTGILYGLSFSAVVAWARFYLRAHTPAQLIAGFLLGMVISSLSVSFFAGFF